MRQFTIIQYEGRHQESVIMGKRVRANLNKIYNKNLKASGMKKQQYNKKIGFSYSIDGCCSVPWSFLETFLANTGITIYEMFKSDDEEYNHKYLSLNDDERTFIELCESLDEKYYSIIERIMDDRITPWWEKNINIKNRKNITECFGAEYATQPFERLILAYLWRKGHYDDVISEPIETTGNKNLTEILYKWKNSSTDFFPEYSKKLDISLHWLLCLTEKTTCYSNDGRVDMMFDYYKLMSERNQKFIMNILRKLHEKCELEKEDIYENKPND